MLQNKVGEQKYYKLFGHYSLIVLLSSLFTLLSAQTFADFKSSQVTSFKSYSDEKDKSFNNYLKAEWEAYAAKIPLSLYEKSKPKEITPAQLKRVKSVGPRISIHIKQPEKDDSSEEKIAEDKEIDIKKEISQNIVIIEKVEPAEVKKVQNKDINFDFYGTNVGFNIPNGIDKAKYFPLNKEGIGNFFYSMTVSDYLLIIEDIEKISKNMNLNDWGKYQLITKLSVQLFSNKDEARLFSWFIFNKLGYAVRVGLSDKKIVLMHYSDKIIYAAPNYKIDSKRFYVVSSKEGEGVGRLYTYKQNYPGADKPLDLSLKTLPNFNSDIKSKALSFKQFGNSYSIDYDYNQNLIDFMATYPQANYETFFNAPMEQRSYEAIARGLKKYIDGKQASEAMNFVLSFVQNAFEYETDFEQFKKEKVMFAQETLYFEKSDCEDRAILFAYLVKELFNIGVVGVKYKDHMATALYVPIRGDSVNVGSRKYVIADPTYVNATIGQSMPKYKPIKPDSFIVISKTTKIL